MSCKRSQGFLANESVAIKEQVSANKNKLGRDDALRLAQDVDEVIVAKGKKVVRFDTRKESPDDEVLLKAMLGPTGNLRAPVVRRGKTLVVGFSDEVYGDVL